MRVIEKGGGMRVGQVVYDRVVRRIAAHGPISDMRAVRGWRVPRAFVLLDSTSVGGRIYFVRVATRARWSLVSGREGGLAGLRGAERRIGDD